MMPLPGRAQGWRLVAKPPQKLPEAVGKPRCAAEPTLYGWRWQAARFEKPPQLGPQAPGHDTSMLSR